MEIDPDSEDPTDYDEEQSGEEPSQEEEGSEMPSPSEVVKVDAAALPDTDTPPSTRGNLTHGQVCTSDQACQEGMRCLRAASLSTSVCFKTCDSATALQCGPGTGGCCNITITGIQSCNMDFHCDPVGPTFGCDSGSACYFLPCAGDLGNVQCSKIGKIGLGQACSFNNDCKPGLNCVSKKCRRTCRLNVSLSGGCTVGTCIPRRIAGLNSTTYGYCPEK